MCNAMPTLWKTKVFFVNPASYRLLDRKKQKTKKLLFQSHMSAHIFYRKTPSIVSVSSLPGNECASYCCNRL